MTDESPVYPLTKKEFFLIYRLLKKEEANLDVASLRLLNKIEKKLSNFLTFEEMERLNNRGAEQ